MAISDKRLRDFAQLSAGEMLEWLASAVEEFFHEGRGPEAFSPFELFFLTAESQAQALSLGVGALPARARAKFKSAVGQLVRVLAPADHEAWTFVAELIWRIESYAAVDELERRFNEAFISEMIERAPRQFDVIITFLRNSTVSNSKSLVRLLRRIVSSTHFNNSHTVLMLMRLCEIDPDGWTEHMAVTRDPLRIQWTRIHERKGMETMRASQDRLALQIYRTIGFDRMKRDCGKLSIVTGAPYTLASDNWFWRALFERARALVPFEDGTIAPADRPNDRWKVKGKCARYEPPVIARNGPPTVDEALGVNSVPSDDSHESVDLEISEA